ncbi:phosphotransferase [Alloalcanivorax gelatiniphagus]|uniref:Phosphotransferase family protein n=1 Tax=Alloalcanivorax gelatiniphagus TaxID=1194167 RepID=A0ABY2XL09_9GAMM|nr:phosphotransferase [Alloalcanivorax gelatiniphagus]TMW12813.1 phosphotransferase family protein [Alloalcanivorax gelatiniphagus]
MSQVDTLDTERLTAYLEEHVPGFKGPMSAEKFEGGQSNPTFRIKASSGEYVLRRQPPGKLLKSAHAVDREFRVMNALRDSDVPVPRMYHLCEDPDVIGSMFYLMEFCQGRIFWDAAIPEVDNDTRTAMYTEMNRVLAALHDVDLEAVGLTDYGKPGSYFERQLGRWTKQYRASEINPIQAMEDLMVWLEQHQPADDGQVSLVHGDYRLDNMMWHPDEARVIAVLDWELSTLGHPLADLAYQCMQLRMPPEGGNLSGLQGKDRHALGIPTEQEYVAMYCQRRGIDHIDHWEFYLAFSFFRLAAIAQGVAKRAQEGNASSKRASWAAQVVEPLAAMAMKIAREGA